MKRFLKIALLVLVTSGQPLLAQSEEADLSVQVADVREIFLSGDYATGFPLMLPLAEAGHPRAQNLIAAAYQYGHGVSADAAQAVRYFELSRAQGYPPAMHNLGVLYQNGMVGLAVDPARARAFYAEAAALDYGPSMTGYGGYLINGTAGPADVVNAIRMFERAAELGDRDAHEWLGYVYEDGIGVQPDLKTARHHYIIAATLGLGTAQNTAGYLLEFGDGGEIDLDRALDFYFSAIQQDLGEAGVNAAWLIFDNPTRFPDQVEGLSYCYWAVENALPEQREEYRVACDEVAAGFTPSEQRLARKAAAAL